MSWVWLVIVGLLAAHVYRGFRIERIEHRMLMDDMVVVRDLGVLSEHEKRIRWLEAYARGPKITHMELTARDEKRLEMLEAAVRHLALTKKEKAGRDLYGNMDYGYADFYYGIEK